MSRIFISYRRDDSAGYAGRLYERLSERFGQGKIFMHITIKPGLDFVEVIEKAVGSCDVLIALIGRQWLTITDATGTAGWITRKTLCAWKLRLLLGETFGWSPCWCRARPCPVQQICQMH
jgi:hypothetical protein